MPASAVVIGLHLPSFGVEHERISVGVASGARGGLAAGHAIVARDVLVGDLPATSTGPTCCR